MKRRNLEKQPIVTKGYFVAIGVVVAAMFTAAWFHFAGSQLPTGPSVCIKEQTVTNGGRSTPIGTKECVLSLEILQTKEAREKGLSDRTIMPASRGALFVFDQVGRQCIWMKDMHFKIDIVWLDVHENVLKLKEGATPESYPEQFCADNTYYVIEVLAGVAKSANLVPGVHIKI